MLEQPNGASVEKLARLVSFPASDILMRNDSVSFPPGGCTFLHTHQAPGLRCLIEGGIRINTEGRPASYGPQEGLRHLVAEVGADRLMIGTDYPYPWTLTSVEHVLDSPHLSDAQKATILGGRTLLGIAAD